MTIEELIHESHETAKSKGWWDNAEGTPTRTFGDQIALMHSELSEASEEFRKHEMRKEWQLYCMKGGVRPFPVELGDKPEGIAAEFADVLIRIADTCGRYHIPIAEALKAKLFFNKTRPYRHGGKAL